VNKKAHRSPSARRKHLEDIKVKRQILLEQIEEFNRQAELFMPTPDERRENSEQGYQSSSDEDDGEKFALDVDKHQSQDSDEDDGLPCSDDEGEEEEEEIEPEKMDLQMPSTIGPEGCNNVPRLMELEIKLRTAQAHDSLQNIRDGLIQKNALLKEKQSHGRVGQKAITRSWNAIHRSQANIDEHVKKYTRAFKALRRLQATEGLRKIKKKHLRMSRDIIDAQRVNQSKDSALPWIWTTGLREGQNRSAKTQESGLGEIFSMTIEWLNHICIS